MHWKKSLRTAFFLLNCKIKLPQDHSIFVTVIFVSLRMKLKMEAFFIQSVNQYRRILLYKTSYQRAKELHLISMRVTGICSCASEVSEFSVSGHHCML